MKEATLKGSLVHAVMEAGCGRLLGARCLRHVDLPPFYRWGNWGSQRQGPCYSHTAAEGWDWSSTYDLPDPWVLPFCVTHECERGDIIGGDACQWKSREQDGAGCHLPQLVVLSDKTWGYPTGSSKVNKGSARRATWVVHLLATSMIHACPEVSCSYQGSLCKCPGAAW